MMIIQVGLHYSINFLNKEPMLIVYGMEAGKEYLTRSIILGTVKKMKVFIEPHIKGSILFPYRDIVLTGIIIL